MARLRVAYITETSPADKHAWSGTAHYVQKSLADAGCEIIALGPAVPRALRVILGGMNKLSLALFKKRFDYRHSVIYSKAFGKIFSGKLRDVEHDIVLVCGATEYGAYLRSSKPVHYVLDRTIAGALNYHEILLGLWGFSKKQSVFTDAKAMREAALLFFSSQWAAKHAADHYGISENKIKVLPFGANMDKIPDPSDVLKAKTTGEVSLLLIGSDWINKGADIAFNTLMILHENGVNARLTVVGCEPPPGVSHDRLRVIRFIDKNSSNGLTELWQLFLSHHFFILPTRFDCTPIVFCEASAFGVPVLSADTGGVRGHVKEGVNGFLFPYEDKGPAYAQKIMELSKDAAAYQNLRLSTRRYYESTLNWRTWAEGFLAELRHSAS